MTPVLITRGEILSTLESLRFTLYRVNRGGNPDYVEGFDDCLSAVARAFNIAKEFEAAPVIVELPQLNEVTR